MPETRLDPSHERVLPAAVSPLTTRLVAGRPRRGVVRGVYRYGVYLEVAGNVLPVLARDAVALPTALRLALTSDELRWEVGPGDRVEVGGNQVRMPGATIRGVRTWRPGRVRPAGSGSPPLAVPELLREAAGERSAWLLRPVREAVGADDPTAAVAALVGRGSGLTPSGDDALAGALLVQHALLSDRGPALARAVRDRLPSTTAVSAALLVAAADGWAAPEVVALVDAAVAGHVRAVGSRLAPVLAIGHDSGRDLVAGIAAGLSAPDTRDPTRRTAA
jgi:hypothetical protein